jgi:hypothetical protein
MIDTTVRERWIAAGRREPVMFDVGGEAVLGVLRVPRSSSWRATRRWMSAASAWPARTRASGRWR